jgi:hypothetical protein
MALAGPAPPLHNRPAGRVEAMMTDTRPNPPAEGQEKPETEGTLGDLAERASRRVVTAIVIAGTIVGLAIYSRPGPPRFQAFAADGQIVRIDTRRGTVIACEVNQCWTVVRRGQRLKRPAQAALPRPAAERAKVPAAPAPEAAPASR